MPLAISASLGAILVGKPTVSPPAAPGTSLMRYRPLRSLFTEQAPERLSKPFDLHVAASMTPVLDAYAYCFRGGCAVRHSADQQLVMRSLDSKVADTLINIEPIIDAPNAIWCQYQRTETVRIDRRRPLFFAVKPTSAPCNE
jgi:hypothetical protein